MINLTDEQFEQVVQEALDLIPEEFVQYLQDVIITVKDEPDPALLNILAEEVEEDGELFGYYEGLPVGEKSFFDGVVMPDTIHIFKGPHERACETLDEIVEEVVITVLHEIAHHFGFDDEQLAKMGYE